MNDRITALRHVIDMAQDFTDDKVLGYFLEKGEALGLKHDQVSTYAHARQQECIHAVLELADEAETADAMPAEKAKLALAVAEPFNIEGMMVLSTGHVSADTMKWLAPTNHFPIIVKGWS